MLGWAQGSFHKKRVETRNTKLVFLHLVGCAGHVMETREGLNPDLSVETEDNSIGEESQHSRADYNRPETLRLSNQYTNSHG
jgi:hypothetical protein